MSAIDWLMVQENETPEFNADTAEHLKATINVLYEQVVEKAVADLKSQMQNGHTVFSTKIDLLPEIFQYISEKVSRDIIQRLDYPENILVHVLHENELHVAIDIRKLLQLELSDDLIDTTWVESKLDLHILELPVNRQIDNIIEIYNYLSQYKLLSNMYERFKKTAKSKLKDFTPKVADSTKEQIVKWRLHRKLWKSWYDQL